MSHQSGPRQDDAGKSARLARELQAAGVPEDLAQAAFGLLATTSQSMTDYVDAACPEEAASKATRSVLAAFRQGRPEDMVAVAADWATPIRLSTAVAGLLPGAVASPLGLLLHQRLPLRHFERALAAALASTSASALFTTAPEMLEAGLQGTGDWTLFAAMARHDRVNPRIARLLVAAGYVPSAGDVQTALLSGSGKAGCAAADVLWQALPPAARQQVTACLQESLRPAFVPRLIQDRTTPIKGPARLEARLGWLLEHGVSGFAAVATVATEQGIAFPVSLYDLLDAHPETLSMKPRLMNREIAAIAARAMATVPRHASPQRRPRPR